MTQYSEMTFDERQKVDRAPLPFKIYKGMGGKFGAMRMMFKRPWQNELDRKQEGVIFIEMAPATGRNVYDWENQKVKFAIGITDIGKLINFFTNTKQYVTENDPNVAKVDILHDKNAGTANKGKDIKILSISKTKGRDSFFFGIAKKNGSSYDNISVPIAADEAIVMLELFKAAVSAMLAWTAIGLEE